MTCSSKCPIVGEVNLHNFIRSNALFTGAIYKETLRDICGNCVISPFSLLTILALIQSGAKRDTGSQIRTSLQLPSTSRETEILFSQLVSSVKGAKSCTLKLANKVYVKNTLSVEDSFRKLAKEVYRSEVENIDFSHAPDAADSINIWVEQQTNHKIKNLIDARKINNNTKVILVNALYFKGKWSQPFDVEDTEERDFYKTPTDKIQVDTMMNNNYYNYCEHPKLKAKFLEMSYKGNSVSMVIVLPNETQPLSTLENQLDAVVSVSNFTKERVYVLLPKFKTEGKFELKSVLENLGILKAFKSEADFSGMAGKKGDIVLGSVIQKVFIDVNEAGTEAAAATAIEGAGGGAAFDDLKDFIADRPFLFYVKLKKKKVVLFVGKYTGDGS